MKTPAPSLRARSTRRILQIGLVQGALLLLIWLLPADIDWLTEPPAGRSVWLLVGALLPMALMLLVPRDGQRGFLRYGLLIMLPCLWLGGWADAHLDAVNFAPFDEFQFTLLVILLPALLLILLPFCQARLQRIPGPFFGPTHYAVLTLTAWHNAFSLSLSTLLLILGWAMMIMFMVLGGTDGHEARQLGLVLTFGHGLMTAVLILMARHPASPAFILPWVMRGAGLVLLPMLSLLTLALCLVLPFIALDARREAGFSTHLLLGIGALMLPGFNAVHGDFSKQPNYHAAGHQLIRLGLLCLPVLTVLALQALWLRIGQHGLSQMRVLGLLSGGLIAFHAVGYAIAVARSPHPCASIIRPVNIIGAGLAALIIVLLHSPWLDPNRLTVDQQLGRLLRGDVSADAIDLVHLRFDSGTYGWQAIETLAQTLEALQVQPASATELSPATGGSPSADGAPSPGMPAHQRLAADPRFVKRLHRIRHAANAWEARIEEYRPDPIDDPAELARHVIVAPGTGPIEEAWWARLLDRKFGLEQCLHRHHQCVLIEKDLIDDERPERLLCLVTPDGWGVNCLLYTRSPKGAHGSTDRDDGTPRASADASTPLLPDTHPGSMVWDLDSTVTYSGMDPDIQRIRERLLKGEVPSNRYPDDGNIPGESMTDTDHPPEDVSR